jgi:hypothetical protein
VIRFAVFEAFQPGGVTEREPEDTNLCAASRLSGYACSCERHGASRRFLALFSPAASALRLTVSGIRTRGLELRVGWSQDLRCRTNAEGSSPNLIIKP